ncbi:MAG: hypothetical protein HY258_01350 [Chloroflexi bacterium]|nr:hypothetical protein [Chloroflexota bacterium]
MTEEKTYTLSQAQLHFAIDFHGKTWELLEKKERTPDEQLSHASMRFWEMGNRR